MRIVAILFLVLAVFAFALPQGRTHGDSPRDSSPRDKAGTQPTPSAPLPRGELPWKKSNGGGSSVAPSITGPRDLLARFDINDEALAKLVDGAPLTGEEQQLLLRILYRLPLLTPESLARWSHTDLSDEQIAEDPAKYRAELFAIDGRVASVARVDLPADSAAALDFPHYWRVTMKVAAVANPLVVFARRIPQAWQKAEALNEPGQLHALFLKTSSSDGEKEPQLMFAADRIVWHPEQANQALGISADHVYLAKLGLDLGQLDNVVDRTAKEAITSRERECFYQLLAAVGHADLQRLAGEQNDFDLVALLERPQTQRGRIIEVTGNARQVMKIAVNDKDIQKRFGIDHYYQVDIFVPLAVKVRMTNPNDPKKNVEYERYPVTVCLRRLPPELEEPGTANVYQSINRRVQMPAVYFKIWSVSTERMRQLGADQRQANPMFVASELEVLSNEPGWNPLVSIAVGAAFVVALGAVWIAVWRSMRGDEKFESEKLKHRFEVPEGESLDDQGIEGRDGPDFSSLK